MAQDAVRAFFDSLVECALQVQTRLYAQGNQIEHEGQRFLQRALARCNAILQPDGAVAPPAKEAKDASLPVAVGAKVAGRAPAKQFEQGHRSSSHSQRPKQ